MKKMKVVTSFECYKIRSVLTKCDKPEGTCQKNSLTLLVGAPFMMSF